MGWNPLPPASRDGPTLECAALMTRIDSVASCVKPLLGYAQKSENNSLRQRLCHMCSSWTVAPQCPLDQSTATISPNTRTRRPLRLAGVRMLVTVGWIDHDVFEAVRPDRRHARAEPLFILARRNLDAHAVARWLILARAALGPPHRTGRAGAAIVRPARSIGCAWEVSV